MSLELHRQCILPALAVVGGVDGINIPPPARELGGVIPADTVELHGMDAAQRTDKPLRAVLPMIQIATAIYTQACLRTSLFCFLLYQLSLWWVKYRAQPEAIST